MGKLQDYYSLLSLGRSASAEEIRQAYFDAARRLHPDINVAPGETEQFIDIQVAYEVLSNPKKRASYDASLPPEIIQPYPIERRVLFSRGNLLQIEESQLVYALMQFSPRANGTSPISPPKNICLVIDRSTSMQGTNIDVVKTTAIQIARNLNGQDFFSLITFSDRAEIIVPAERKVDIKKMEARIHMIQCSGGTEIFSGLDLGYKEIFRNQHLSSSNHIIILTDGRTYGDEEKCLELARKSAENGISIRGLGIGPEWNDSFMDNLTSLTGGNSVYISRPQDIPQILFRQINQLSRHYTEETRLDFKPMEHIDLHYAFRISPEPGLLPLDSPIQLGPVVKDGSLQVLFEFMVHSVKDKENVTLLDGKVFVTFPDPDTKPTSIPIKLERQVKKEISINPPDPEIIIALSKLTLYRLQEQIRREAEAGEFDRAAEHLQKLATHLLACGERGLARTALLEAAKILQKNPLSKEGQKELKYGTRALLISREGQTDGNLP